MDEQTHKYQCAVRYLIQLRKLNGKEWFVDYIYHPKRAKQLEPYLSDIYDQWIKGNQGIEGEWYE